MRELISRLNGAITRGVDWFIPVSLQHVRSSRGLARVFVFTQLFGSVVSVILLAYLTRFVPFLDIGVMFLIAMTLMFVLLPFALRQTANMSLVTMVSFQAMLMTSLVGTFEYGGFASPFLPWLLVSLMSGLFYQSQRTGLVLGLFMANVAVYLAILVFSSHPGIPQGIDLTFLGWISIAIAMTYMAYMALYYARLIASRSELELEAERHRAVAAELEQAQAAAVSLNHNRSLFFSKMSHELRTPLNAIIGFSEIMESGMFGPLGADRYEEYCKDIRNSGEYLLDVINDVLDMAKIEAGRIRLDFEDLALDPLLGEAMRVLSARAEEKQLALTARLSPDLSLRADRRALKQIVLNLLSNAVKFTPAGGQVTIRARNVGDTVVVGIADTGIGIAPDALARLGRPFEQVESQLVKSHPGSGLGLANSNLLVVLFGGRMSIRSTVGRGTMVLVRLPLEPHCPMPREEAA